MSQLNPPITGHHTEESAAERSKSVRWLITPSTSLLFLWMAIPLAMTIWFSFSRYNLLNPDVKGFAGFDNFQFLVTDPAFGPSIAHTLTLIISVLVITVVGGVLFDRKFFGQGIARLLVIAPLMRSMGMQPIDWFAEYPLFAVIVIVAWQWLPFAFLILFTAIQSLDQEQKEAARIDGAGPFSMFFFITLPHLLWRAISVVVVMETIFLLSIFAEIYTTTGGGPGTATTNLSYLIYALGLQQFDVGFASAGGIFAVILANIVAFFLVRMLAKNLKGELES